MPVYVCALYRYATRITSCRQSTTKLWVWGFFGFRVSKRMLWSCSHKGGTHFTVAGRNLKRQRANQKRNPHQCKWRRCPWHLRRLPGCFSAARRASLPTQAKLSRLWCGCYDRQRRQLAQSQRRQLAQSQRRRTPALLIERRPTPGMRVEEQTLRRP